MTVSCKRPDRVTAGAVILIVACLLLSVVLAAVHCIASCNRRSVLHTRHHGIVLMPRSLYNIYSLYSLSKGSTCRRTHS